jgi:Tfp pilus assembly protein PilX
MHDQRGLALPIVISILLITGTLASVAVTSAVRTQRSSLEDRNSKRALQAADAGLDAALYRLNMLKPDKGYCVRVPTSSVMQSTNTIMHNGWCDKQPEGTNGEDLGDGASYTYRVSELDADNNRTIVSTGVARDVTKRLAATAQRGSTSLFNYAAVSYDPSGTMQISGFVWEECGPRNKDGYCGADVVSSANPPTVGFNLASSSSILCGTPYTNGTSTISGHLNPYAPNTFSNLNLCQGTPGVPATNPNDGVPHCGSPYPNPPNCPVKTFDQKPYPLSDSTYASSDVSPAGSDDCRLDWINGGASTCSPAANDGVVSPSDAKWDPTTKSLVLKDGAKVDLYGSKYVFCYLEVGKGATLTVRNPTAIWLRKPDVCKTLGGGASRPPNAGGRTEQTWGSVSLPSQSSSLINLAAATPPNLDVATLQIYLVGSANSSSYPTWFDSGGNGDGQDQLNAVVWAPRSSITLRNDGDMTGALAGKTVAITSNFRFKWDDSARNAHTPATQTSLENVVQCTSTSAGTLPIDGC